MPLGVHFTEGETATFATSTKSRGKHQPVATIGINGVRRVLCGMSYEIRLEPPIIRTDCS